MKHKGVLLFLSGLAVGILLSITGLAGLGRYTNSLEPTPTPCDRPEITRDNIRIKMNEARLSNGLQQTVDYPELEEYAQARADEIGPTPNLLTHKTQYGDFWRWAENKYDTSQWGVVGENLVTDRYNACAAIQAFLDSPTHRDMLLASDIKGVGIGTRGNSVVIIFGSAK